MDENSYRRVMSRNLDEFGLNQTNNPSNSSSNQQTNINNSSSNTYDGYSSGYSNTYNTTINRGGYVVGNTYNARGNAGYYSRPTSNDYSSDYGRKKNNINLKQIKAVGLSCAKNLTNKLINLSNTVAGTSHSSGNRNYGAQNVYSTSAGNNKYSCSSKEVYVINSSSSGNRSNQGDTSYYASNTSSFAANAGGYAPSQPGYGVGNYAHTQPGYVSGASAQSTNVIDNRIYTLKCIADRIATTSDLIKTHRELVAVIERCLTHSDFLVEITIEKDRFGAPTLESINKFSLINKVLVDKILTYIKGRRDCCIFVVKFATWRMRTTKKPEEVILSLELLQNCMNEMGGYFLGLFTKSLMKTLRKLLFATNLKHSITSGVKKKITKFLGKSSYVHPGISTDIRIHIFKSKIMYMVQLYYEVFLFEQGEFVVFYDGYKDMRIRGIKFPTINPEDKEQINKAYTFSSFNNSNSAGSSSAPQSVRGGNFGVGNAPGGYRVVSINLGGPLEIDVKELDQLLYNINNNNYDEQYIQTVRQKLLGTIETLSSQSDLNEHYSQLLDKILRLNDSLLMLCNADEVATVEVGVISQAGNVVIKSGPAFVGFPGFPGMLPPGFGAPGSEPQSDAGAPPDKPAGGNEFDNLLELGESSAAGTKDEFDFFNTSASNSLRGFSSVGAGGLKEPGPSGSLNASASVLPRKEDVKENLDDIFNFISLNAVDAKAEGDGEVIDPKDDSDDDEQLFEDEDELINNFINSPASFNYGQDGMGQQGFGATSMSGSNDAVFGGSDRLDVPNADNQVNPDFLEQPENVKQTENLGNEGTNDANEPAEAESKPVLEKNLSQLVSELDNLELDFGHMSVNNF